MPNEQKCMIWKTDAAVEYRRGTDKIEPQHDWHCFYNSSRCGGVYLCSRNGVYSNETSGWQGVKGWSGGDLFLGSDHDGRKAKARLVTWMINQRKAGVQEPEITLDVINIIKETPCLSVKERADRLLEYLANKCPSLDSSVVFHEGDDVHNEMLAWSESLEGAEMGDFLVSLEDEKFLRRSDEGVTVTEQGHIYLGSIKKG